MILMRIVMMIMKIKGGEELGGEEEGVVGEKESLYLNNSFKDFLSFFFLNNHK